MVNSRKLVIIGHQKQWQFLKAALKSGRVPHALLFEGQEKLGKKTFAFEFVKLINCQNKDFSTGPCQNCLSCKEIEKGKHPDFILVEPLKKQIQISQIRDLGIRLASKPFLASFKSAIINQAHFMTREAQSCFLKTLEEPKGKTLLILITEYPERLLPTIISRVQKIKFYPVKKQEIKDFLLSQGISEKKAEKLSIISSGKPGLAIDFLSNPTKLEERAQKISALIRICNSPLAVRFQYTKTLSSSLDELKEILEIWLTYFRNKLLEVTSNQQLVTSNQPGYSLSKLKEIIQLIQETIFYLSTTNINPRLALERLMLELYVSGNYR